ncbi:two-component system, sensor histidine kinase PdtaS [Candidatus Hakubella thermalkaliphila]|uniref:histidine kinase n=1 Tax=Candidatus Hakubella thermalkaliphila TaxID=2754717 RepID=A0A6V8NKU6_9ACTN|nr:histidine kinase N-terminal domain-containing protein [Candidatus Hakubella thermalkaliphila]GFP20835.1 two-component system, sensor histidine kinase PdtaS [Candidatus Hakubella thermalkaliphila]
MIQEICQKHTDLSSKEIDILNTVSKNLQLVADLYYSDILLYCRIRGGSGLVVVDEIRPRTAESVYSCSQVGRTVEMDPEGAIPQAFLQGKRIRSRSESLPDGYMADIEATPIKREHEVIAVYARMGKVVHPQRPGRKPLTYSDIAEKLSQMIYQGKLHEIDISSFRTHGDGLIEVDQTGRITFVSPNAVSTYRKLGLQDNLLGMKIDELGLDESVIMEALRGMLPREKEVSERGAVVQKKAIPLFQDDKVIGALAIVRDITDLRQKDRVIKIKEITLQEIHHRIKNNLQAVSSLLRMQARRARNEEAKEVLSKAINRISIIATVHDLLAKGKGEYVDFSHILKQVLEMMKASLGDENKEVSFELRGRGFSIPADDMISLTLVITELVQNATEHAFIGRQEGKVLIDFHDDSQMAWVEVRDDGVGLPPGFGLHSGESLGFQIVRTLVEEELGGYIRIRSDRRGTSVKIYLPTFNESHREKKDKEEKKEINEKAQSSSSGR